MAVCKANEVILQENTQRNVDTSQKHIVPFSFLGGKIFARRTIKKNVKFLLKKRKQK